MSLRTNIEALATRIGTEFKAIRTLLTGTATGNLSGLTTADKTSVVAAINEVNASAGGVINDAAASLTTTYSSTKIAADLSAAVSDLINGAPGALDTLNELAAALGNDANYAATITNALALKADIADTFSVTQLGAAVDTTDYVAVFEAALL